MAGLTVPPTLIGAGAPFVVVGVEVGGVVRVLETEGEEGFTEVLERRFSEGVVVVLGFGVGAVVVVASVPAALGFGTGAAPPGCIPSSDNNDFLLLTDGVLPTEGLSVIL